MKKSKTIWVPIKGYEGSYEVSDDGKVRSKNRYIVGRDGPYFKKGQLIKLNDAGHYLRVGLWKNRVCKMYCVHYLVIRAFKGKRPKGKIIRHLDGNRYNNKKSNLKYGTSKQNGKDTVKHKVHLGSNNGNAVLNEDKVAYIKYKLSCGYGLSELGREFFVLPQTIYNIKVKKQWKHVVAFTEKEARRWQRLNLINEIK